MKQQFLILPDLQHLISMAEALKFPTFECVISNSIEDYDSEVEYFFLVKNYLSTELAELRELDPEWKENYEKIIRYLSELGESIVTGKQAPSHDFLIKLSLGEEIEDDSTERLLRSKGRATPAIMRASTRTRELMYWYVRNSKVDRFSKAFDTLKFQGLPFVRLALTYRSIVTSNKK
jgi:hypothetical protein